MRIILDPERCTGLGLCEAAAPDVFEVQPDGSLTILDETPAEEAREAVEDAILSCPTEALRLVED
jgi:ferredoxin